MRRATTDANLAPAAGATIAIWPRTAVFLADLPSSRASGTIVPSNLGGDS